MLRFYPGESRVKVWNLNKQSWLELAEPSSRVWADLLAVRTQLQKSAKEHLWSGVVLACKLGGTLL